MARFFSIDDNSFYNEGFPWITTTIHGRQRVDDCPECRCVREELLEEIIVLPVLLDPNKGSRWPDALGSGDDQSLIVSERVLRDWQAEGVGEFPVMPVRIIGSLPEGLKGSKAPPYYWLQGEEMFGARVDFEASGFVDVHFCSTCGRRTHDISATYDRQHYSGPWSYEFVEGSWNGANLFTTDISSGFFFCTDAVVECARKYHHSNFRFVPVEEGDATDSPGFSYM